uniref:hypothetical protein n=1 Tax=Thaumasiovibrio occultus TaxID=1891184 RepID=UPI000B35BE24|nr:hypothetical protein [Thaumasiovibrio occultus]
MNACATDAGFLLDCRYVFVSSMRRYRRSHGLLLKQQETYHDANVMMLMWIVTRVLAAIEPIENMQ